MKNPDHVILCNSAEETKSVLKLVMQFQPASGVSVGVLNPRDDVGRIVAFGDPGDGELPSMELSVAPRDAMLVTSMHQLSAVLQRGLGIEVHK
jgi:hypothetical protein